VAGLDDLASAVVEVTRSFGVPPEHRRFQGHITLARCRPAVPPELIGRPVAAGWPVRELALVRSHLGATACYETIASVGLVQPGTGRPGPAP
jgi:2'-5' RNA ligase